MFVGCGGNMIKIGQVGLGNWGKNLFRVFLEMKEAWVVTVCDLKQENLDYAKGKCDFLVVTQNYDDIISNPEIQAVVIASTGKEHHELAKKALLAGKHVYIEKPLTLKGSDAQDLIKIAEEKNKKIMVGHLLLYHPSIKKLKEIIDSGSMGDIYYMYSQRVNLGIVRKDENSLWNFAPHDISVILHLMGETPLAVNATGKDYLQEALEDVVFVTLHFPSGRMAHIHISWLDPHKIRKLTIVGSAKMVVFDDMEATEKIRIYDKAAVKMGDSYADAITLRSGDIHIPKVDLKEPLGIECKHFIECIEKDLKPLTDGYNGLATVKVLEAADLSLKNKGALVMLQ
jgi:predicted dehydrogenase